MTSNTFALPGDKITATSRRDWFRSMVSGVYIFGPAHRRLIRAARSNDRQRLHQAEKGWAHTTSTALGLTIDSSGLHHVDPARSYVVVPLHEGFADLLALQHLPLDMVYATAEELFDWHHLGPYLHASAQPSVSRTNGPQAYRTLLRAGKAAAARGESLVVFPQGTVLGIETKFTGGAFRAAQHLNMPILPVILTGASSVWDYPFSTQLHFGRTIHMEVLDPVPPHLAVALAEDIESEMKDRALAATPGPRRYVPERDGWWDDYRFEIDPRFSDLKERVAQ
ncbi:MAG: 1-acyl-sn-glycerol-3-phosphate acyltransferase, partial [Actinomycetia bacterium]|nr:1-acyl-sn-glycerol-3-phosphate acyltransferase [Actinomycetes bacterium]